MNKGGQSRKGFYQMPCKRGNNFRNTYDSNNISTSWVDMLKLLISRNIIIGSSDRVLFITTMYCYFQYAY